MAGDPHRIERELGLPDWYRALAVWADHPPADRILAAVHLKPKTKKEKRGGFQDFLRDMGLARGGALSSKPR